MIVTDIPAEDRFYPELITGPRADIDIPRSTDTLHLSEVLRDMRKMIDTTRDEMPEAELDWWATAGWVWEHALSTAFRESVQSKELIRPGEFELDGIVGSPDMIYTPDWAVWETKARWMSSWKFDALEKNFYWELMQVKGYCKMMGTDTAELHVLFLCGDYHPPRPLVRVKRLEFKDQELDESWAQVVRHAGDRGWL